MYSLIWWEIRKTKKDEGEDRKTLSYRKKVKRKVRRATPCASNNTFLEKFLTLANNGARSLAFCLCFRVETRRLFSLATDRRGSENPKRIVQNFFPKTHPKRCYYFSLQFHKSNRIRIVERKRTYRGPEKVSTFSRARVTRRGLSVSRESRV